MVEWGDTIIKLAASWYLHYPVVDKTLFEGGRNFTLNWNSGDHVAGVGGSRRQMRETKLPPIRMERCRFMTRSASSPD
jgi:hypothetical protein